MQSDGIFHVISYELDFVPDDQLEVMALVTFQLWRRIVPCPIYILETFNGMTTACDKTFWSRIQVTYHHENKTTISDIPLHFHHIKKIISICVFKKFSFELCLVSHIRSKIGLIFQLFWAQKQPDPLHYFLII